MGRPVRFTGPAAVVSWSRTPRESERESGAERVTVVGGGVAAKTVSAAARTRTVSRLLRSAPTRAWRWPVPERSAAVTPVVGSTTSRKAAVSTVAQAMAEDTASPRPSSARAWGRRVSTSSTLSSAATSIATTWLKSGPSFPHAAAAARASASAPAPRGPHRVTAPPPILPRETRRTTRGRAGPGWRARSTFARRAPWADAPGTPAGAGRRRRDRRASAAGRRARSYGLAFLLLKRGDPDGAAQHLRAFLAHPPRGPDAQRWIEHANQALRDLGSSGGSPEAVSAEAP